MPAVYFTERSFPVGEVFDTRDFCQGNRDSLADFPEEYVEVERLLNDVRLAINPDLPDRMCSILVIPWPETQPIQKIRKPGSRWGHLIVLEPMPDPAGAARYCYYVLPKSDTKRIMVDDRWVQDLIARWNEISQEEAQDIAKAYWNGQMFQFDEGNWSVLFEGHVLVHSICRSRLQPA